MGGNLSPGDKKTKRHTNDEGFQYFMRPLFAGWGSAAPRTAAGKAAGMIYALLGAPLLLLWLAAAGGLLARLARRAAARCRPQAVLNHHQVWIVIHLVCDGCNNF